MGLVRLVDSPDNGQSKLVEITERGEAAFHEVLAVNDKFCREFERRFDDQDVDVACQVVEQIQDMLDSGNSDNSGHPMLLGWET